MQIPPVDEGTPVNNEGTILGIQLICVVWIRDGAHRTSISSFSQIPSEFTDTVRIKVPTLSGE